MKKGILFMYCLMLLLSPSLCFGQNITIAAARIEPIGVEEETARLLDELITTSLTRESLFTVIERRQIDTLIEEQKLQQSGITDTSSAVEAGAILNADKILFGSIGKYESKYVEFILSLRLIDVERAEVEQAESIQVQSVAEIPSKVEEIIGRITAGISITGKITGTEEDNVFISLGSRGGIAVGDVLSVYRTEIIRDDEGMIMMREEIPLANLRAEKVQPDSSKCRILESKESLQKGFFVQQGKAELGEDSEYGSITVLSRPEGALVFLEEDFLGETPLSSDAIPAGDYHIEIRAGGYKPYHGAIKLSPGRTVSIERELEKEIEIEDLILLGKLPRRATDPSTALTKAFIPGQGLVYNGYKNLGLVMPTQLFALLSMSAYFFFTAPEEAGAEPAAGSGYWDFREYYRDIDRRNHDLTQAAILAGYSLGLYTFSIIDSALSAEDDFLHPVYLEISFGGAGSYSRLNQTSDDYSSPEFNNIITSGMESFAGGGFMDATYMGRNYHFIFGIDYLVESLVIRLESAFRFNLTDNLFLGLGVYMNENVLQPSEVELTSSTVNSDFKPSQGGYSGPLLQISFRPSTFCLDGWFSPWTIGRVHNYTANIGETWAHVDTVSGIWGCAGGLKTEYYFNLTTGIRFSADVYYIFNNESLLADLDNPITSADSNLCANVKLGMVYRF